MEQTNETIDCAKFDLKLAAEKLSEYLWRWHVLVDASSERTSTHWFTVAQVWCDILHQKLHCLNEDIERACYELDGKITNSAIDGASLEAIELIDLIDAGADGSWRMK